MRPRIRQASGVVAVVLCWGLGSVGSAQAAGNGIFGIVSFDRPTPAALQQMAANGVSSMRLGVGWGFVEPRPGQRDWSHYDELISDVARAGIQPAPLLFGVPGWISPQPAHPPIYTQDERNRWTAFVHDLADRYGQGGAFWRLHPELPYLPLVDWEIWNEPNLSGFWDGRPSPRGYAQLLRLTRSALRSADPTAQAIVGGIFPPPRRHFGVSLQSFLTRVYRAPKARRTIDGVAIHPYAKTPKGVLAACMEARRLLNRNRDRRAPLWITELGWTTGGVGLDLSPYRATEQGQAQDLTRAFRLLLGHRHRLKLRRIFWHTWQDLSGSAQPWTTQMGLLRADGSPKPSLSAYAAFAR
jgi:polysaccharide biosynthesis protein PslG